MKKAFLFITLFFTTLTYAQVQGEMEIGLGSIGYSYENILDASDAGQLSGIQAQFDYDFIQGPFRAAIGIKVFALTGYTFIQPGVKLGKDIINLNISVLPSGLTYYGLSSRIGFGPNKQHAIDLSLQGAANFDYGFGLLVFCWLLVFCVLLLVVCF